MPKRTPFTATLRLGTNPLDAAAPSRLHALRTATSFAMHGEVRS